MNGTNDARTSLLLTAHCDDAELWAGGAIDTWTQHGWRVVVAIAYSNEIRRSETMEAASILGYTPTFRSQEVEFEDWVPRLLEANRPTVLLCHPGCDPHPDHATIYHKTLWSLTRHRERKLFPRRWYAFDTYYLARSQGFPLLIDITDSFAKKCAALNCHHSQGPSELVRMARHINGLQGLKARVRYAEAFYPFDLLGRWPVLRDLP